MTGYSRNPGAKWKDIRTVSVSVTVLLCCDHEMDLLVSRWPVEIGSGSQIQGRGANKWVCFSLCLSAACASAWAESVPLEVRYWDSPESKEFNPLILSFRKKIFGEYVFFFLVWFPFPEPTELWFLLFPFPFLSLLKKYKRRTGRSFWFLYFFLCDCVALKKTLLTLNFIFWFLSAWCRF